MTLFYSFFNDVVSFAMTLTNSNRWAAAGAIGGAALVIYHPLFYRFTDTVVIPYGTYRDWFGKDRNITARNKGTTPTLFGYILHAILLFFVAYFILSLFE